MIEECQKFNTCSFNRCPLDPEAYLRNRLDEEGLCPYARDRKKWGKREAMPKRLFKLVPKENIKMLSAKNQRRLRTYSNS